MKIYVAGRFENKQEVREAQSLLRSYGHQITHDWTKHLPIKPYSKSQELARQYGAADMEGVRNCDVFILLAKGGSGTGSSAELGAAIGSNLSLGKPKIYVVGDLSDCVFFYHPSVNH